jgi:3',5'-cyclic AMP phosphodiesterase CpdA
MKIAHLSDLHLYSVDGVHFRRFLNKRLTGWANIRLRRAGIHRPAYVRAIAREITRLGVDHVIITGDLTNLALEPEYELVRNVLQCELGLDPANVTVIPGNHDIYTRGSLVSRRFETYLAPWLRSDLPELAANTNGGQFPAVKLFDSVAIIALSSAVPRLPLASAGELGSAQIVALRKVLEHPEVARRTVVLAMHHPAVNSWSRAKAYLEGLRDAPALLDLLRGVQQGLLLHGHLHRRIQRVVPTHSGFVRQVGATSASLHHDAPDRMAGFNLYELTDGALARIQAHVYLPETGTFQLDSVPKHV